jgi:GT2 family glycosyltransferase
MYQSKIDIVVQSKYPKVLAEFKEGFLPTTQKFENLTLHILDGTEYGAKAINKIIYPLVATTQYFGVFNDDLWFVDGWLEDTLNLLQEHWVVSAGYVETQERKVFERAVELTKNETGVAQHLYGPNAIFRMDIFKKIGVFDEQFDWSCDDLDWAWRIKLNGLSSVTSKKITMAHKVGISRGINSRAWNVLSDLNKERFYHKHGYWGYRNIRNEYKTYHQYFRQFKGV